MNILIIINTVMNVNVRAVVHVSICLQMGSRYLSTFLLNAKHGFKLPVLMINEYG